MTTEQHANKPIMQRIEELEERAKNSVSWDDLKELSESLEDIQDKLLDVHADVGTIQDMIPNFVGFLYDVSRLQEVVRTYIKSFPAPAKDDQ